jgi:hypothetical protein
VYTESGLCAFRRVPFGRLCGDLIALGFSNTVLPGEGNVQIQLMINSYFKDGQHPGVDISRDSWYFTVPVQPTIGPK